MANIFNEAGVWYATSPDVDPSFVPFHYGRMFLDGSEWENLDPGVIYAPKGANVHALLAYWNRQSRYVYYPIGKA